MIVAGGSGVTISSERSRWRRRMAAKGVNLAAHSASLPEIQAAGPVSMPRDQQTQSIMNMPEIL
jgi:hypothetical protein